MRLDGVAFFVVKLAEHFTLLLPFLEVRGLWAVPPSTSALASQCFPRFSVSLRFFVALVRPCCRVETDITAVILVAMSPSSTCLEASRSVNLHNVTAGVEPVNRQVVRFGLLVARFCF